MAASHVAAIGWWWRQLRPDLFGVTIDTALRYTATLEHPDLRTTD